jgi:hypothetical protein
VQRLLTIYLDTHAWAEKGWGEKGGEKGDRRAFVSFPSPNKRACAPFSSWDGLVIRHIAWQSEAMKVRDPVPRPLRPFQGVPPDGSP